MNYTALALQKKYPNAKWTMTSGTEIQWVEKNGTLIADNFIWHENTKHPTKQEIDDAVSDIKQEIEASKYKSLRSKEYPSIGDQLDALFKAGVFPEDMANQIQAIKDKYPKG